MNVKRISCLALILVLGICLVACGSPKGAYSDDSGLITLVFQDDQVTAKTGDVVLATGTFRVSGDQVIMTFTGQYADYLNNLASLTYDSGTDTLTDDAGSVLYRVD